MRWTRMAISFLLILGLMSGIASAESMTDVIVNSRTAQSFTDEAVSEADLELILEAGLAATSAINQQPWFFVAVTNQDILNEIKSSGSGFGSKAPAGAPASGMPGGDQPGGERPAPPSGMPSGMPGGSAKAGLGDSPAAIIIYMNESTASPNPSFDCGLACENMFIAAKSLGYGAKIISSPTMQLNGANHDALCEKLGVDKAYTAVAVLLIGHEADAVDGTTNASVSNSVADKVSIVN